MATFWDVQQANKTKSYLLIGAVIVIITGLVWLASSLVEGGEWLLPIALIFSILYAIGGYYFGDKIVLAVHGARPADEKEDAYLYNTVEGLALAAQIPKPKLYIIDDPSPNAFATGRDPAHASIAVTTGLYKLMNRAELEGVLGHEMSHIKNFDSRFMTLTIVLVGLVSILANMIGRMFWYGAMSGGHRDRDNRGNNNILLLVIGILIIILGPLLAQLIRLAISRSREYLADASSAQLTRNPDGLASALGKLKMAQPMANVNSATASLFISDPTGGAPHKKGIVDSIAGLLSTHPPLDERIQALKSM